MFDVYVDGATGTSRDALRELARAMGARYGLPAVELEARLMRGRFRVKSGVDRATAEAYLRDLSAIGARVRVEPAGEPAMERPPTAAAPHTEPPPRARLPPPPRSSVPVQPGPRTLSSAPRSSEPARSTRSSLPPQPEARPGQSSLPPQPEARPGQSSLPPSSEPARSTRSSLPLQPERARPGQSSLPPPSEPVRSTRSSLPPQPEARPGRSSLPPPSEPVRSTRSSLPPSSEPARSTRSSLPPPSEPARSTRSSLPAQPEPVRSTRSSLPAQPEPVRSTRSSLPAQPEARPGRSSLPPAATGAGSLAPWRGAATSPAEPTATLGALDRSDALTLATLDDKTAPGLLTDGTLPASMGPAAPRPPRPPRARNEPVDPFVPPEPAGEEPLLELADDDRAHRARGPASAPPANAAVAAATAPQRPGSASAPPANAPGEARRATASIPPGSVPAALDAPRPAVGLPSDAAAQPPLAAWLAPAIVAAATRARRAGDALEARIPRLASPRVRLATGVALAVVLGFIPAHLVAGMRERSAFGAIDAKIAAVQSTADTPDSYAALDAFRAEQLDAKYGARRSIVVTSLLVWAAAGAALAYGWFGLFRARPPAAAGDAIG